MKIGKLGLVGAAAGMVLMCVPAANAVCVYCDSTGCHVTSGSCPGRGGAAAYNGHSHINCFGCGASTGTAELTVTGVTASGQLYNGTATASYTVSEGTGITCVISGSASGSVTGVLNLTFTWQRVGALAVITTAGDINGVGVASFVVTSPSGVPCGGPVDASVSGTVVGT